MWDGISETDLIKRGKKQKMKKLNSDSNRKTSINIFSAPFVILLCLATTGSYAQMKLDAEMKTTLPVSRAYAEKLVKPTGKRVEYDLYVKAKEVNITGKRTMAIVINDNIPGPTLYFTEGDVAVIRVHNQLATSTTMHWHGVLVPNRQDGVAFLNTPEIKAGETHTFEFPIVQSGTYWYHSHDLQEQKGEYGSIVIQPQKIVYKVDKEIVLQLSDWTNDQPNNILKNLKRHNDWSSIRKNTIQPLVGIIKHKAVGAYLTQSFRRMPSMDISDFVYDRFLINGKDSIDYSDLKPGSLIRLRVINAGAATYFHVQYAGEMLLISADGLDVQPVKVNHRLMGMGEVYDFLVTVPQNGAAEFRASAQDGSGSSSVFLGKGDKMFVEKIAAPDLYNMTKAMGKMDMISLNMKGMKMKGMDMKDDEMQGMDMKQDSTKGSMNMKAVKMKGMNMKDEKMQGMMMKDDKMEGMDISIKKMDIGIDEFNNSNYEILKSTEPIVFPKERPLHTMMLELVGDMRRYIWGFNGKPLSKDAMIPIKRGEVVRVKMINTTMMYHPIHFHGHFFRVLNGQGEYAPLKHSVSLAPMETVTIEFLADETNNWIFHCHLLYHMATGMARVMSYEGDNQDTDVDPEGKLAKDVQLDNKLFFWGTANVGVTSNYLNLTFSNNKNVLNIGGDADWKGNYEVDANYEHYLGQYLRLFGGVDIGNEKFVNNSKGTVIVQNKNTVLPVFGVRYLLPFLIDAEAKVNSKGNVRFQLAGGQRLTRRLGVNYRAQWQINNYTRLNVDLDYVLTKNLGLFVNYDTRYGQFGGGLGIKF